MTKAFSDYTLHRQAQKRDFYQQSAGLWWSYELRRWMCTSPELIRQVLAEKVFEVPSYSVEKLTRSMPIQLSHHDRLVTYFPLAIEGEAHKSLKKRHITHLAQHSQQAIKIFEQAVETRLNQLLSTHEAADLYSALLHPCLIDFFCAMIGITPGQLNFNHSISQVLDETLPLMLRIRLDHAIGELIAQLPDTLSTDEKYFRVALFSLGVDSTLGAMTESVVLVLQQYADSTLPLSQYTWPDEIPVTGVPVIERTLAHDFVLQAEQLQQGDRIRLYLDAAGVLPDHSPQYAQLYFGGGRHTCPGMPIAKQLWQILISALKQVDKKLSIIHMKRRERDNVFNIINDIKVRVHDKS